MFDYVEYLDILVCFSGKRCWHGLMSLESFLSNDSTVNYFHEDDRMDFFYIDNGFDRKCKHEQNISDR